MIVISLLVIYYKTQNCIMNYTCKIWNLKYICVSTHHLWTCKFQSMTLHFQVKLCARLASNLLDMATDVRSLVKDLLPKPVKKSSQDATSETPAVPDPASGKSVVEGTVSIATCSV